jgi:hypothetical protein
MSRAEYLSFPLSRCTLLRTVATWSGGKGALAPWREDPVFVAREEAELRKRLKALTPQLEVLLDAYESRGLKMQRASSAAQPPLHFGNGGFTKRDTTAIEFHGSPEFVQLGRELAAEVDALLRPAPPSAQQISDDQILEAITRLEEQRRREPTHLHLARWLELASAALGDDREVVLKRDVATCAVCGEAAIGIAEYWTGRDWDATPHEAHHTLCLSAPHVVTGFEN